LCKWTGCSCCFSSRSFYRFRTFLRPSAGLKFPSLSLRHSLILPFYLIGNFYSPVRLPRPSNSGAAQAPRYSNTCQRSDIPAIAPLDRPSAIDFGSVCESAKDDWQVAWRTLQRDTSGMSWLLFTCSLAYFPFPAPNPNLNPSPFWPLAWLLLSFVSAGRSWTTEGPFWGCGMRMLISKSSDPIQRINIWQTYAGRKTWNVSIINAILNLSPGVRCFRGVVAWMAVLKAGLRATCHLF